MKRICLVIFLAFSYAYSHNGVDAIMPTFTNILDKDRGYVDSLPFDMYYIPSLFSVRHQMHRYGIELPHRLEGTGYEFAQLSTPVYAQVSELLKELNFNIQSTYILRLHPAWKQATTTVIATNACIFIDEEEWCALDNPHYQANFSKLSVEHGWDVHDPIKEIKKYILKRALAHHHHGTYRKKVASKLLIGAALGFVAYKTMSQVHEYLHEKDVELGMTESVCNALPTVTKVCSTLYITAFAKWWSSITLSSLIGNQIKGAFQATCAQPLWRRLDARAETAAVADAPYGVKKLLASYNASQAIWKSHNQTLKEEYVRRSAYLYQLTTS